MRNTTKSIPNRARTDTTAPQTIHQPLHQHGHERVVGCEAGSLMSERHVRSKVLPIRDVAPRYTLPYWSSRSPQISATGRSPTGTGQRGGTVLSSILSPSAYHPRSNRNLYRFSVCPYRAHNPDPPCFCFLRPLPAVPRSLGEEAPCATSWPVDIADRTTPTHSTPHTTTQHRSDIPLPAAHPTARPWPHRRTTRVKRIWATRNEYVLLSTSK